MRKVVFPLIVAGLSLAGCEKTRTPEGTPPATPAPEPPKAAAAATPAPKQLAPEGVYFLRTAQRVETDAGIIGIKRGTQLQKVGENSYATPSGEKLKLTPDLVTNDLIEAKEILRAEQTSQAALQSQQQNANKAAAARQAEQRKVAAATPNPPATRTTTTSLNSSSLNAPAAAPVRGNAPAPRSTSLGGTHSATKIEGGFVWKKNADGEWYVDHPAR